jgi:hypothetical protein
VLFFSVLSYCSTTATGKTPFSVQLNNNNNIELSKYSEDIYTISLVAFSEATLKLLTKPTSPPLDNIQYVSTMSSLTEIDEEVWIVSNADEPDETGTYFLWSSVRF